MPRTMSPTLPDEAIDRRVDAHHPQHVRFSRLHVFGALVRQSSDRQRDGADRARQLDGDRMG